MGVGSGIGGQLGLVAESAYNTPVTVTRFLPVNKASVKLKKGIAQATGIVAGLLTNQASQRVRTTTQGTVSLEADLLAAGFGPLLQLLMGTTVVPVQQGATAAYLQTHTLADPAGKSLTIQAGVPDTQGVVRPYTASGCKIVDASFSFDINSTSPVSSTWTIDAGNVVEAPALAAASYTVPLARPYVGTDVTIKVGVFNSEASVSGVTKVDVKIPRPMKVNRFYFGNAGLKMEPITNARAEITGTINADFVDKTVWADRFASDTSFSLVVTLQGALIAATFYQTFTITLPTCFIEGDTPELGGVDVVSGSFPFVYRYDGVNLPKITYQSTDVTL